jgi:hypothetical protein
MDPEMGKGAKKDTEPTQDYFTILGSASCFVIKTL